MCAWIDVSNSLNPESAAAVDLDLSRLLWVRCGVPAGPLSDPSVAKGFVLPEKYLVPPRVKKGLHGGGFGQHPRKGLARFSLASKCCREIEEEVIHIQAKPLFFHKRFQTNNRGPDVVRWAARCG